MIEPISVLGFGYVAPYARLTDVPTGVEAPLPKLDLALLERTLRRGLSEVTRLFMHAAKLALSDASFDAATQPELVHVIFASAFGEIGTAEALFAEAYETDGSSPARFRNSVHNTAPGLFSISNKNHLPSTAIAAGWDTVAMGLCEAAAQLQSEGGRVLLVFAEERVPLALSSEHSHGPLAAAFVLARGSETPAACGSLSQLRREPRSRSAYDAIDPKDHPLAPVLQLVRMLEEHAAGTLRVGDGETPWCIDVDARASTRERNVETHPDRGESERAERDPA